MKVLQIAPLWERIPPPAYGGIESVVGLLCEELQRAGVEVALFASGDSDTPAELHSVRRRSLRASKCDDPYPYQWVHTAESIEAAADYDIIHNHAGELPMSMHHLTATPMLTTVHNPITEDAGFVWGRYTGWYSAISHAQAQVIPKPARARFAGTVHNGIDVASFPFRPIKDEFLLSLSRICSDKGTHLAIETAKQARLPIVVAGKIGDDDRAYFREEVEPLLNDSDVRYIGEAGADQKRELFSRARCLLLPISWDEPFGLVMAEAMACGTPVVAFSRGAAPELIRDGETGFLVDESLGVRGLLEAVHRVGDIRPATCRRHVEDNFSARRMGSGYLQIYERILNHVENVGLVRAAPLAAGSK